MLTNQFTQVYQFKVTLKGITPSIWRKIQVPDNYSFDQLHAAIQDVMDWIVCAGSFYEFQIINPSTGLEESIGCACLGYSRFMGVDEPEVRIADYFTLSNTNAHYASKEESRWDFSIKLETILPADEFEIYPICIKGRKASPPEDCGGVKEYKKILETLEKTEKEKFKFDPDNIFFTSGSGNPPLPDDLPEKLLAAFKKSFEDK